ncbi:MAG: modification methylase, partial [Chloroflexota bacterium]|nr:modification methylase [Chloroflexota bacterium]
HEELRLYKRYNPEEFPHYDNYDAIEVSKTKEIPYDWDGAMGVPISFLDKHSPEQFEILGADTDFTGKLGRFYVNGRRLYARIVIRRKRGM